MVDVTGILRRVRRLTGLSQRELAAALGVSQSRIARAEATGDTTVGLLRAALELAGLRLAAVESDDRGVPPMRSDGCSNSVGSRLPPYADPVPTDTFNWQQGTGRYDRRAPRFRYQRGPSEAPHADHPADSETFEEPDRLRREKERQERLRLFEQQPLTFDDLCHCGPECERECLPSCECQCEPEGISTGRYQLPDDRAG